jgi:uncharacterized membrane protein YdjX (TVP38/TMEM64 family)
VDAFEQECAEPLGRRHRIGASLAPCAGVRNRIVPFARDRPAIASVDGAGDLGEDAPMSMWRLRLAALVVALAAVITAWRLGVFHAFGDPALIKEHLVGMGALGYLVFVLAYALLQPFGLPGMGFCLAAALVWPWPVAFALSMTGSLAATAFGFVFARFIAREWVARILPERFKRYDASLAERAFATVFILRLMFQFQPLLHAFVGLSRVRFSTYMAASAAAYVPPIFLITFFGQRAIDFVREAPLGQKILVAVVAVKLLIIGFALLRWLRKRQERRLAAAAETAGVNASG